MGIKASSQVTVVDVTDAYSVILTSEAYTFVGSASGAPAGLSCATQVAVYCGNQQCSKVNVSDVTCPAGITVSITNNNTSSPTVTFTTIDTVDANCEATIQVEADSVTITKQFKFVVVRDGSDTSELEKELDDLATRVVDVETSIESTKDEIKLHATKTEVRDVENMITGDKNLAKNTNNGSVGWGWILDDDVEYITEDVVDGDIIIAKLSRNGADEYLIDSIRNDDGMQTLTISDSTLGSTRYNIDVTNASGTQSFVVTPVSKLNSVKSYIFYENINRKKVIPDVTYTVSFELKSNITNTFAVGFYSLTRENYTLVDGYNANEIATVTYTDVDNWTKFVTQLKPTEKILESDEWCIFINGLGSDAGACHQFKNLQLEEGTEATEWSEGTSLTNDLITRLELEAYQEKNEAELSVVSDKVKISVANMRTEFESADNELRSLYNEIRMNYDFTSEGQFIGKQGSDTVLKLVNDMLQILISGNPVTTLDTKGLNADQANILNLQLGPYALTYYNDGHLRLT